jgi:hypothetical protein
MSNDIVLSIKNSISTVVKGLDDDTRAVAGSGIGGSKRVSIKGGVFRKYVGGKEVGAIDERHMDVVFIRMAHAPARTYYAKAYKDGERLSPSCWSSNSKTPDADVKNPIASSCDKCQMSIKGSSSTGTTSACRLSWRTAVVLPNDINGDVMQLVLPATSVFGDEEGGKAPFKAYMRMLASHDVSAGRVITRMQFDTKYPVPRLLFSAFDAVPSGELESVVMQSKSAAADNAIKLTVFQTDGADEVIVPANVFNEPEAITEPVVRNEAPVQATEQADVSDIVRKWAAKKK